MEKREKRREDEVGDKIGEADIRVRNGNKKKIRQDKKNEEKVQKRKNKRSSKRKPASAKRWLGWK